MVYSNTNEAYPSFFNILIIKTWTIKEVEHSNRKEQIYAHLLEIVVNKDELISRVTLNNSMPFPILANAEYHNRLIQH